MSVVYCAQHYDEIKPHQLTLLLALINSVLVGRPTETILVSSKTTQHKETYVNQHSYNNILDFNPNNWKMKTFFKLSQLVLSSIAEWMSCTRANVWGHFLGFCALGLYAFSLLYLHSTHETRQCKNRNNKLKYWDFKIYSFFNDGMAYKITISVITDRKSVV